MKSKRNSSKKLVARHSSILWILLVCGIGYGASRGDYQQPCGLSFRFKHREYWLDKPMQRGDYRHHPREGFNDQTLDTLSNWYDVPHQRVEIVRQDDARRPTLGIALAFEFDEDNGEYPYTPAFAALQLKNFTWGGLEFDIRDTFNYTGVSNQVSEDISLEITGFRGDTIEGRFSGLLINGAGSMSTLENGWFKVRLYRKN